MSLDRRITNLESYRAARNTGEALLGFEYVDDLGIVRTEMLAGGRTMSIADYYRRFPHAEELLVLVNVDPHRI